MGHVNSSTNLNCQANLSAVHRLELAPRSRSLRLVHRHAARHRRRNHPAERLARGFTLLSLPVLLALYVVQYLVDYIIHVFMAREVKRAQETAPPPLPPKYSA